jgi:hypothetical protein
VLNSSKKCDTARDRRRTNSTAWRFDIFRNVALTS